MTSVKDDILYVISQAWKFGKIKVNYSQPLTDCLKITQNFAFPFFNIGILLQFYVLLKLTCLVTLFNPPKLSIFGIFNAFLSPQNINVARFARNVEWYIFWDFQTPCYQNWTCRSYCWILARKFKALSNLKINIAKWDFLHGFQPLWIWSATIIALLW